MEYRCPLSFPEVFDSFLMKFNSRGGVREKIGKKYDFLA
jgi:hypothetical protein